jgi:hypothetical protein
MASLVVTPQRADGASTACGHTRVEARRRVDGVEGDATVHRAPRGARRKVTHTQMVPRSSWNAPSEGPKM